MPLIFAKLADASHTLPWPNQPGRTFNPDGEMIDPDDPYFGLALRDGSLVEAEPPSPEPPAIEPPAPAATRNSAD